MEEKEQKKRGPTKPRSRSWANGPVSPSFIELPSSRAPTTDLGNSRPPKQTPADRLAARSDDGRYKPTSPSPGVSSSNAGAIAPRPCSDGQTLFDHVGLCSSTFRVSIARFGRAGDRHCRKICLLLFSASHSPRATDSTSQRDAPAGEPTRGCLSFLRQRSFPFFPLRPVGF